ncbi:molybdopterin biosynthesis protein MoeB [Spartobacteria bacterium LR76]|nr:molybdopterin biosynthesis protein MoeB [Spartobacteria bacterium LR76]
MSAEELNEDRFSRFRLIGWWDQQRLRSANVVVIGAGALGNEIVKNLVLLGVEHLLVVDCDRIEHSNLSRSVLFRTADVGKSKARTAAEAARELSDGQTTAHYLDANVMAEVGLGVFGWADVIIAGLDNREARLWINRCAWKMDRPWVDGAIEGINGVARVFLPGRAPCYECTLGETDWQILERRMSCNLLTREEMLGGKVPTTPTTGSVIAGIEVQEAVKLLHGLPVLAGQGFVFDGLHHTSYVVEYTENPDCLSHEVYEEVMIFPGRSDETTLAALLDFGRERLGAESGVVVEFSRDVIRELRCPRCGVADEVFAPVGTISAAQGRCPRCETMREVVALHGFHGEPELAERRLSQLGLPAFDVFTARKGGRQVAILIDGDRADVLGPLAEKPPGVWPEARRAYAGE